MYHAIVRRRVAALFAAVSNGDARPVLEGLAPRFEHFFLGDHALGGSRFTLERTRLWYEPSPPQLPVAGLLSSIVQDVAASQNSPQCRRVAFEGNKTHAAISPPRCARRRALWAHMSYCLALSVL